MKKELVEYIGTIDKKNKRTMSNEIAIRFEKMKVSEEAIKKSSFFILHYCIKYNMLTK